MSGGEISLQGSLNGQHITIRSYGVGFKQSAASSQPMFLYKSAGQNSDGIATWKTNPDTTNGKKAGWTKSDTSMFISNLYVFDSCDSTKVVNCDHPFAAGSSQIIASVIFPDTSFNKSTTRIFICFPAYRCVVANGYNQYNAAQMAITGSFYAPVGALYKLVILANKNGVYYYNVLGGLIPTSSTLNLTTTMNPVTNAEMLSALANL